MAYTIPVPERLLHSFLLAHLPPRAQETRVEFVAGRVVVSGGLCKMGLRTRFLVEFEPSASSPDETAAALSWQIRTMRPFYLRWLLRAGFYRVGSAGAFEAEPWVVSISLDELLQRLPAWKRLPASLRGALRLQHWWMPSDGRGAFLVFTKDADAVTHSRQRPQRESQCAAQRCWQAVPSG